jgi:hypothetical protein
MKKLEKGVVPAHLNTIKPLYTHTVMAKDIVLKDVEEEQYWEWKREKSDSEAHNWVEFFKQLDENTEKNEVDDDES